MKLFKSIANFFRKPKPLNRFLAAVLHEATVLRDKATYEEKNELQLWRLDPNSQARCVYGLMTGTCTSKRACELMSQACQLMVPTNLTVDSANEVEPYVESCDVKKEFRPGMGLFLSPRQFAHYSALEAYIMLPQANCEGLLNYIKGNINSVKL
jgi:hypothetical protein